jgi:hypothetical protein
MAGFERNRGPGRRTDGAVAERAQQPGKQTLVEQAQVGVSGAGQPLPFAEQIQASFGPLHDVSSITAHVGGQAADAAGAIGAEAYASGDHVAFGSSPSLHTAAHEAAHVIQQRDGVQLLGGVGREDDTYERHADLVADRVVAGKSAADLLPARGTRAGVGEAAVQMRRVPTNSAALLSDTQDDSKTGENYEANAAGLRRLIEQAGRFLTPLEKNLIQIEASRGMSAETYAALPEHVRLAREVDAIYKKHPRLAMGDPTLIGTAPKAGSVDATNMAKLVENAGKVFDAVLKGHDKDLAEVFGAANVAVARKKYANGKQWMNNLAASGKLITDPSGYATDVGLGGYANFHEDIQIEYQYVSSPDDKESIVMMVHEAMHSGNADVLDNCYAGQPGFTELSEKEKLGNAAHFEVVPRRILGADNAYRGKTFVPAATSPDAAGGGPVMTPGQQALRGASEAFRLSWTAALALHAHYLGVFKDPKQWTAGKKGRSYRESLPYWSKVQKLTIHERTGIDPAAANPALHPVTTIDMALSESCVRQLSLAMYEVPRTEADTAELEKSVPAAERAAAHASPAAHAELLVKLVLGRPDVGPITGPVARDARVVDVLAKLKDSSIMDARDPASFPD